MTREEAIEELERLLRHWDDLENDKRCFWGYDNEAVALALSALRPITREQVEKVRGEWTTDGVCSRCGFDAMYYKGVPVQVRTNYCPACGSPMTDKAVDMVMERLEALYEET